MRLDTFIGEINETELLQESINDLGIFKAVFMAGFPGAGKTYVLTKVKSGQIEPRMVSVDRYVEFKDPNGKDYMAFYDRSKTVTATQLLLYINSLLPLAVDVTSSKSTTVIRRYNILENLGYDMGMIFVNTSAETSWERIQQRSRKVDRDSFLRYYDQIQKTKEFLKGKFPFYIEVKNDTGELTDEVVLGSYKKVSYFYESSIKNPIGQGYYNLIKSYGWKYLTPNVMPMAELKGKVADWYR